MQILQLDQSPAWDDIVRQACQHDFYHLAAYHALAEAQGEGTAHLFVYRERQYTIALPLLLRPLASVRGLGQAGAGWWDATSVYGYPGPISSHAAIPAAVAEGFQAALREALLERRVVAAFSRLHPLIPQPQLLAGLGQLEATGRTVSVDLALPAAAQIQKYRGSHRRDINKLARAGMTCFHDRDRLYLGEFVDMYYETMRRVHASARYFFEPGYFERLFAALGDDIHLFVCRKEKRLACGGIFTSVDRIVQYHLGGTRAEFAPLAPTKLLLDTVRSWACERGARVFHLGGGLGAKADGLFHFKAGFSDRQHDFYVWRCVLSAPAYARLCDAKLLWNERNGMHNEGDAYFPLYRCPAVADTVEELSIRG